MSETEYRSTWEQTAKAVKYLHGKGCFVLADSIPSGYGEAHFLKYRVSDASDKMRKHVAKAYPAALIEYVSREEVVYGKLERDIALAEYRLSL